MKRILLFLILSVSIFGLSAQEDWGTEFDIDSDADFASFGQEGPSWSLRGTGTFDLRLPLQADIDWEDRDLGKDVNINTEFTHKNGDSQFLISGNLNQETLEESPEKLLDEAYIKYFSSLGIFQLGLMKVTWGKSDSLQVLDTINGRDYGDFINQDDLDRKISAPMAKLDIPLGFWGMVEALYIPQKTADQLPLKGDWTQRETALLMEEAYNLLYFGPNGDDGVYAAQYGVILGGLYSSVYAEAFATSGNVLTASTTADGALPALQSQAALLAEESAGQIVDEKIQQTLTSEDEISLKNSQAAIRLTGTAKGMDFGLQYLYGFSKIPLFPDLSSITEISQLETLKLEYPRIHQMGIDGALVLLSLNLRTEISYTLAQNRDYSALDTLGVVAGFDRAIPLTDLTLNYQYKGTFVSNQDAEHNMAMDISGTYLQDKLEIHLAGALNLPDSDYLLYPQIKYKLTDNLSIEGAYKGFFGPNDSLMGQFYKNSFGQVKINYFY